jgi:DNA-directed RNA polymerase subunit M/transcription elongation factor TFIIS
MEDYNQEEQQSEDINGENIEYSEEILKSDSIECPNCKKLEKIVLETLRRTESFKVKPFEIMVCKNCGNVFCDVDEISNTL